MTEFKDAQAAVKAAEKAYETASKKALTGREKYLELQGEANAAARALTHARSNPALYDDDPLSVVVPALGGVVLGGTVEIGGQVLTEAQHAAAILPYTSPDPGPGYMLAAPPDPEPEYEQDAEGYAAPVAPQSAAPWEQPPAAAEPAAAPAKRKRRTKAQIEADNAAAAAQAAPAAPAAPAQAEQSPQAAQQPYREGHTFVGYDQQGQPVFQPVQAQPPAAPPAPPAQPQFQAQPGAAPWETGAQPMY